MTQKHRRQRLTALERELLARAAQFVLAGEWPWETDPDDVQERERDALERAADKILPTENET